MASTEEGEDEFGDFADADQSGSGLWSDTAGAPPEALEGAESEETKSTISDSENDDCTCSASILAHRISTRLQSLRNAVHLQDEQILEASDEDEHAVAWDREFEWPKQETVPSDSALQEYVHRCVHSLLVGKEMDNQT